MKRVVLLLVPALLVVVPAWAWTRHAAASDERDASMQSLVQARAHVTELTQAAASRGTVLESIPEAEILAAVNTATTNAGLPLSSIRELSVRVDDVRRSSGTSSVQRTQLSLLAVSPDSLGRLLRQLGEQLPTAVPTSIRVTHAGSTDVADMNSFETLIVLEQIVLGGDAGDSR